MLRDVIDTLIKYYYSGRSDMSTCEIEYMILKEYRNYMKNWADYNLHRGKNAETEYFPHKYRELISEVDKLEKGEMIGMNHHIVKVIIPTSYLEVEENSIETMYKMYNGMKEEKEWVEDRIYEILGGKTKEDRHTKFGNYVYQYIDKNVYRSKDIIEDLKRYRPRELKNMICIIHEDYYNELKEKDYRFPIDISYNMQIVKEDVGYRGLICERGTVEVEDIEKNSNIECKWQNNSLEVDYIQTLKFRYNTEKINRSLVIY